MKTALIVVDVQMDFLPGGALAVTDGGQVVPVIRQLMDHSKFDRIVATQDWHPAKHASFAANHPGKLAGETITLHGLPQVLWPVHCVQYSAGAEIAPELNTTRFDRIIQKGTDPQIDSYSGFFDNGHRKSTGLAEYLRGEGVTDIAVAGLATDYCVKFTALDGVKENFRVRLIEDACRGVNLTPGDVDRAIHDLRTNGIEVLRASQIITP